MSNLDTRSYAWCNLGALAGDGTSIAADPSSGTGLRKLRGTVNLLGVLRPAPGTIVQLAYSDGQNWLARLPLRLRVLSSFCNPLERDPITSISVGCDLAYFEDRKQPPASLLARYINQDIPEAVWRVAAPAIPASLLVQQILSAIGLTAATQIPLTNYFTLQEFDMTAGYIEELGKLCVSEQYIAYMTADGLVDFAYKAPAITAGPLLTEDHLIDFNPINTGELPGEAVFAKYNSKRLKYSKDSNGEPDEDERKKRDWERDTSSVAAKYTHQWSEYQKTFTGQYEPARDAFGFIIYYFPQGGVIQNPVYEVKTTQREETYNYVQFSATNTQYDDKDRVTVRTSVSTDQWGESRTETRYTYRDAQVGRTINANQTPRTDYGDIILERTVKWSPLAPLKMTLGLQAPYYELLSSGTYQASVREISYDKDKNTGITRTITKSFVAFANTTEGSEVISRLRASQKPWDPVDGLLPIAIRLVPEPQEEKIRTEREFGTQRRPPEAVRTANAYQNAPDVEDYAETTWAIGSATSQTSVELSPPYVSDDRITKEGNTWRTIKSDAGAKALFYAQNENRFLLGYRNGNGIQVLPEMLPLQPLGMIYIRLNGCTAAFLVDSPTWNINAEGVSATCDAVFWGAVDGTVGNSWFPLAPGATALPATAGTTVNQGPKPANAIAIPQGFDFNNPNLSSLFSSLPTGQNPVFPTTITPGAIVPPYYETIELITGAGIGMFADVLDWGTEEPVELIAGAGIGMFGALGNTEELFVGAGIGAFAEASGGDNLAVNWSLLDMYNPNEPGYGPNTWTSQSPSYTSTPTSATMTLFYNVPADNFGLWLVFEAEVTNRTESNFVWFTASDPPPNSGATVVTTINGTERFDENSNPLIQGYSYPTTSDPLTTRVPLQSNADSGTTIPLPAGAMVVTVTVYGGDPY